MFFRRLIKWGLIMGAIVFVAIQFVPYGRDHSNPRVLSEPNWNNARTQQLAEESCYSCHSNETKWPWYSNIAPMSWLVQADVDNGRDELNFSELEGDEDAGEDSAEVVADGAMPPLRYVLANPGARLNDEEKRALVRGFSATFGEGEDNSGPGSG